MSRIGDIILSLTVLVVLFPLMAIIALSNWILTRGVFFRQVRVGRAMRPFTILKFQTMVAGPPGTTVTVASDRRVTTFGRLLRTTKLDELPQLINVLRGEMSLVGPRALPPNEVARIPTEVASLVYSIRPGMTGLASLVFPDEERLLAGAPRPEEHYFTVILPRKMALESQYVRQKSLWLDARIMAGTPLAVLFPKHVRTYLLRMVDGHESNLVVKESMR